MRELRGHSRLDAWFRKQFRWNSEKAGCTLHGVLVAVLGVNCVEILFVALEVLLLVLFVVDLAGLDPSRVSDVPVLERFRFEFHVLRLGFRDLRRPYFL